MEKDMKKFALFIGCNIPVRVQQYELSARAVLNRLGIDTVDIDDFNCCGYPLKNINREGWLISAARNIALAEKEECNILILCKCCFGSLKKADALLREDGTARERINGILSKEGLNYTGDCTINHLLSVLHNDVTIKVLDEKIAEHYKDLRIATHYGCHALRPSDIMEFDDPAAPSLFDDLVNVTGASSIEWASKLECCGAPALGINDSLSRSLTENKLKSAEKAGAHFLCVSCPFCQMQFDKVQELLKQDGSKEYNIPSILYTQLLGLRLGLTKEALGLEIDGKNKVSNAALEKLLETREKKVKKKKKKKKAAGKPAGKKVKA